MKIKTLFILIICLIVTSISVEASQVRKRTGYLTTSTEKDKMVTTYYLVDEKGVRFSTQEYDYLEEVTPNVFIAKTDDKYGLINGRGVGLVPFEYEEIKCFKSNIFRFKADGKYGLMDYSGNIFMPANYSYMEKIDDRIIKMSNSVSSSENSVATDGGEKGAGLVGLMDFSGKIISEPRYSYIDKINNYMLRVIQSGSKDADTAGNSSDKKYGLIDYQGRIILSPQYDYINKLNDTILQVKKGSSWGRIEYYKGNIINIMFDYQSYW